MGNLRFATIKLLQLFLTYQNSAFSHRVFELVTFDDLIFLQYFEGIALASVSFYYQKHLAVGSLANTGDRVEVLGSYFACLFLFGVHNILVVFYLCLGIHLGFW
jgi:hypothetical protein